MQKEKKIRTYTRKTKTGKTVTVKAHTAKYDAAEEARKAFAKKAGAGDELSKVKTEKVAPAANDDLGFSAEDYKAWYHWDTEADPKNAQALKVKKALIAKMGRSAYNKYEAQMTDSYSARGHLKGFKGIGDLKSKEQVAKENLQMKRAKEKRVREERADREKYGKLVAHVNGDASIKYGVTQLSPMVKDVKFTKEVEGDAYSDFFPKGGSYEFFYGKTKDGRVGLYAKNGRSIIELEETEPSKSLSGKLGTKPSSSEKERGSDLQRARAKDAELKKAGLLPRHEKRLLSATKKSSTKESTTKGSYDIATLREMQKRGELPRYNLRNKSGVAAAQAYLKRKKADAVAKENFAKFKKLPLPKEGTNAYAVHKVVLKGYGKWGDDSVGDALKRYGYKGNVWTEGSKAVTALAKKHGIEW